MKEEVNDSVCSYMHAVRQQCYSHNPQLVVEVRLQNPGEVLRQVATHPTFRYEVSEIK